jgi:hypothetical protein
MGPIVLRNFIIGYSSMIILMIAISGYSSIQLGNLSESANLALNVEQRMIDHSERLADAFLSEVRYGGQFSVTHAAVHQEQFQQFKRDFDRYLVQLKSLGGPKEAVQRLTRTEEYHVQFHQLFNKEIDYITKKQAYAETRYREERERLVDYLLRELEAFKSDLHKSLQQRIGTIEQAALKSRRITLSATLLLAGLGALFAYRLYNKMSTEWESSNTARENSLVKGWLRSVSGRKGFGFSK